ncbi:hypothetical protein CPC08DRAFT_649306 [Agrocybe pediades]|nr:hypothetical protein CPC08DRAFT_649306 [Agrocybe pediades]
MSSTHPLANSTISPSSPPPSSYPINTNSNNIDLGFSTLASNDFTIPQPLKHNSLNSNSVSRRASVISHANSSYSQSGSTRHILADMKGHGHNNSSSDFTYGGVNLNADTLQPPVAPFASGKRASSSSSLSPDTSNLDLALASPSSPGIRGSSSGLSLSVNYLPQKFSASILSPGGASTRKRRSGVPKSGRAEPDFALPKRGGGTDAFKSGEARMPENGSGQRNRKMRWNKFKWILFTTNSLFTLYSIASLIATLLVWFDVWTHADVVRTGNRPELVLATFASALGLFTSMVGWAGILLNNRAFLAWYTFLTWVTFAFMLIPGYISYKKRTFNLEGKINAQWSRDLGVDGRLRIQNQLRCCGYFSPFVEATISQTCYARSILPGCKLPYMQFERDALRVIYTVVFSLVPAQILVMVAGLLCSNHVTYRFGKGMMPERYRLNEGTMKVIWEGYAAQLAEQYGTEVADDILKRVHSPYASESSLALGGAPSLGYNTVQSHNTTYTTSNGKTDPGSKYNAIIMPVPSSPTSPIMPTPTHYGDGGMGMPEPQHHRDDAYRVGGFREHRDDTSSSADTHAPLAPYHAKYNSLGDAGSEGHDR